MKYVEQLAADMKNLPFIYDYHHLISPFGFSLAQIKHRNALLLRNPIKGHWVEQEDGEVKWERFAND